MYMGTANVVPFAAMMERLFPQLTELTMEHCYGCFTRRLCEAFRRGTSLERLTLGMIYAQSSFDNARSFRQIMELIQDGLPCLRYLSLEETHERNLLDHLQRLPLQLQELELVGVGINGENARRVFYYCQSLRTLTLRGCTYDESAAALLPGVLFRQNMLGTFNLRSLTIQGGLNDDLLQSMAEAFASYPGRIDKDRQLRKLHLHFSSNDYIYDGSVEYGAVLRSLASKATFVKLDELTLTGMSRLSASTLQECLPSLCHIKFLRAGAAFQMSSSQRDGLMLGLQHNGSLEHVEFSERKISPLGFGYQDQLFSKAENRQVGVFLRRNAALPICMSAIGGVGDNRTPVSVLPKLCHEAMKCPGTGLSLALAALSNLDDSVGSDQEDSIEDEVADISAVSLNDV